MHNKREKKKTKLLVKIGIKKDRLYQPDSKV